MGLLLILAAALAQDPATVPMPVLAHAVERGATLGPGDFTEGEVPVATVRSALRVVAITGMAAARRLPAGTLLRDGDVMPPWAVRRGEQVTLILKSEGLVISSNGRALDNAGTGATVRVVALATGKTLSGIAEAGGAVRIAGQ